MAEIPRGTQYFAKANSKRSKINQKSPKRPAWRLKIAGSEVEILLISSDSQVIDSVGKKLPWLSWKGCFCNAIHCPVIHLSKTINSTQSVNEFKLLRVWKVSKYLIRLQNIIAMHEKFKILNNVKSFLRINSYDREIMSSWFLPEATWLSSPASRFISIRMRLAIGCCVLYGFFSASALSAAGGSLGSSAGGSLASSASRYFASTFAERLCVGLLRPTPHGPYETFRMWSYHVIWEIYDRNLTGLFSAVSNLIFAIKYMLKSSWGDLSDLHPFPPL